MGAVTLRIRQLQLGVIDVGLILLDGGLHIAPPERSAYPIAGWGWHPVCTSSCVALQIDLGVGQQSLIVRERGLRHIELHLVRTRIDLGQHLALFHQIAFVEADLHQLAVHARFDSDRIEGGDISQIVQHHGDAGARDLGHDHRYRTDRSGAPATPSTSAAAGAFGGSYRVAGVPDGVSGHGGNQQQEKNPDQSAFLWFCGGGRR